MSKIAITKPQVIFRKNKPTGVILGIREYVALLERLEDTEDLQEIKKIKKSKLSFQNLDYFLKENPL